MRGFVNDAFVFGRRVSKLSDKLEQKLEANPNFRKQMELNPIYLISFISPMFIHLTVMLQTKILADEKQTVE